MKELTRAIILLCTIICYSCQTVEQISIDYLIPSEVSFPKEIRKVGIVNNVNEIPDEQISEIPVDTIRRIGEIARKTTFFPGDSFLATEALAEALADEDYFDMVVICDSALRKGDIHPRESRLSKAEVQELAQELGVDIIISLEGLFIKATRIKQHVPELYAYLGTVDAQVFPSIRLYLPSRITPMANLTPTDSIFWEFTSHSQSFIHANDRMISDENMVKEASIFAGTIPVKLLIPYWETAPRYYYDGGSVDMRDAGIYVRTNNWDKAFELWEKESQNKNIKRQMRAAYNIALYYEIKDDLNNAELWLLKAVELAKKTEKVTSNDSIQSTLNFPSAPNYRLIPFYLTELEKRKANIAKLIMQMDRFNEEY